MTDVLEVIAEEVRAILAPLTDAAADEPEGLVAAVQALVPGLVEIDGDVQAAAGTLVVALDALPGQATDLVDAVRAVRGRNGSWAMVVPPAKALGAGVAAIHAALRTVMAGAEELDLDVPARDAARLALDLMQALVLRHLDRNRGGLQRALTALKVIETRAGNPAFDPALDPVGSQVLRPERLREIVEDPLAALREALAFGVAKHPAEMLFPLESLLRTVGLRPHLLTAGDPGDPSASGGPVLLLPVVDASAPPGPDGAQTLRMGLALEPVLTDGVSAVRVVPVGTASAAHVETLAPDVELRLAAEGEVATLPELVLSRDGVTLSTPMPPNFAGGLGVHVVHAAPPDPLATLAGLAGLRADALAIEGRLAFSAADGFEAEVALSLVGARLVFDPGVMDGFLRAILPGEGPEATFDLRLGLSTARGVTLGGGTGLRATLPAGLDLGSVLRMEAAHVALAARDRGLELTLAASGSVALGPIAAAVQEIGVALAATPAADAANPLLALGPLALDARFAPPKGVGLAVEAGPVSGGGFLSIEPGLYAGALELAAGDLALAAFGLVETRLPGGSNGFSMLLFVSGQFAPVQLGFGFTLLGVGGLVGVHRDVDPNALFAAVRTGTAGDLLSPEDPVRDSARLIGLAEGIFPSRRGQYVFGPTVKLGWGTPTMLSLDLALAATLPEPLRLVLIGRLQGTIPSPVAPILRINLDLAGLLDLSGRRLELEGILFDSAIQTIPVEGGFALRSSWGAERALIFSVGGLHPGFEAPPRFPDLPRMGTTLTKGGLLRLTLGGYFAITSNTFQIGAAVDLRVSAAGFTLLGGLGFDALVEFDPFRMVVDIRARVQVMRGRRSITKLTFRGQLSGPNPWHARGKVVVEIPILPDVTVGASATFGRETAVPSAPVDVLDLVAKAIASPEAWRPTGPPAGLVLAPGAEGRIDPRGMLRLRQEAAPLDEPWEHFHGKPIEGVTRTAVDGISVAGRPLVLGRLTEAAFPPAAFRRLTEAQRLAAPAFDDETAGVEVDPSALAASGAVAVKDDTRETVVHGPEARETLPRDAGPAGVTLEAPPPLPPVVRVRPERWRAADAEGQPVGPPTSWSRASRGPHAPVLATEAAA